MILTTNPNEFGVWTYKYLTEVLKSVGKDENNLYVERIMKIKNEVNLKKGNVFSENIYLHHSVYTDNKFLPDNFIADLETETDDYLRAIKTLGRIWKRWGIHYLEIYIIWSKAE